jgi:hypothetical protein
MTKLVCTSLLLLLVTTCFSQVNISPNILASPFQGDRFTIKKNNDVQGSPLLFDHWKSGKIFLANGQVYPLQKLNFDASNSKFIYSINDTIYEIQNSVNEVRIFDDESRTDSASQLLFRSDLILGASRFAQVLVKGKVTILRQFSKQPEGENYSNGIVNETRKYVLHTQDVALIDGKTIPLAYSSSTLKELTSDKKAEVDSYIKSNHLKPKKEDDFLEAINYYNGLP